MHLAITFLIWASSLQTTFPQFNSPFHSMRSTVCCSVCNNDAWNQQLRESKCAYQSTVIENIPQHVEEGEGKERRARKICSSWQALTEIRTWVHNLAFYQQIERKCAPKQREKKPAELHSCGTLISGWVTALYMSILVVVLIKLVPTFPQRPFFHAANPISYLELLSILQSVHPLSTEDSFWAQKDNNSAKCSNVTKTGPY